MPATQPFLVYRDRIGVASEISFLRRQYVGFTRLHPVWIGRTLLPAAAQVGEHRLHLGGEGPSGAVRRFLFRQFQLAPPMPRQAMAPILHAQFARGGALALPLVRSLNLRLAVTLHGGDVSKRKNWRGGLLAQRWAALVGTTARFICVSAAVAEIAAARGVPEAKLTVLPIGVEIPDQPPARTPAAYLFVGRFVEKKGISVLADAMRRLRAQGDRTPLVCVGDGPLLPLLQGLASEVPDIRLTGWQSPDQVRDHLTRAVALVVPSVVAVGGDAEGLPSVIPEAMAQGCPVIGSDRGGIAEAIADHQTGRLVPPGEAGALAAAMRGLSSDSRAAAALGAAGYARAKTELNARLQSAKLETLLLSLQAG
jgi:colanic acid/amylovoran biosynthesis glycosyltransferase